MTKTPKKPAPAKPDANTEARRILRRLQGEDGYDIFADQRETADKQRLLRDYEDNRR